MNRLHATKDFWLAALRADSPALQDAVAQAGADTAVPSCPGWTVADLVEHLTSELRWVRESAARGVTERPAPAEVPSRPEWAAALDGLRRELTGTIETLEALDADFPAWNWAPQAKKASFWQRRMAHEISVHRWDAESAAQRATPIETKLAADGVNEVLDTWLPAGRRKGPTDLRGVVHLVATDASYEWFVRLRGPAGVALLDTGTILDSDDHHARAQATGSASDLLLMLMGRIDTDRLVVTGDPRLVSALRTG
ncbi:maleylpyruvate isomerase family mycothiol-dependent enzyme [Actinoplanes sp. TRM 88003]|uniref:Maleylpyruvate isomerase family mycothiol-dependent enzyme n=1 Tax=Paractinoplanes aksuensis TaxID=2939490 RepID=A0ABT1DP90_9ACTN|nr:maleylpyruvate isomerase family mycothiol-dependent enzyme [Actinoplanes aksuensis]MCO8272634.1 maleylpyruvate isomerase family mycothiol-dependent enzyme [Actinoplanes aksuensis]